MHIIGGNQDVRQGEQQVIQQWMRELDNRVKNIEQALMQFDQVLQKMFGDLMGMINLFIVTTKAIEKATGQQLLNVVDQNGNVTEVPLPDTVPQIMTMVGPPTEQPVPVDNAGHMDQEVPVTNLRVGGEDLDLDLDDDHECCGDCENCSKEE